jgi:hypothetical protein
MLRNIIMMSVFCLALAGVSYGQKDGKPEKPDCRPDQCAPEPPCPPEHVPIDKDPPKDNGPGREPDTNKSEGGKGKPFSALVILKTGFRNEEC